ncbi:MAG: hypothetical protein K2K05_05215 [Muribaculaceae bacterium]|nr:hypothetical protein [Muribaculaceae bacterium]
MDNRTIPWKGYTLDEIRMRRIISTTRIELEKAKMASVTQQYTMKDKKFFSSPLVSKLTGALDYLDYASLAYTIVKRVFKLFRKRK